MNHEIFFPVPPTHQVRYVLRYINSLLESPCLPMLDLDAPHRSIAIVKISGQEVAYCVYSLEKKRIKVERIVVHPDHMRQGIATDIVNAIAERYSPCTVQLTLDANNIEANDWARAVGFGATKFIRGCESSGDKVQLEFMEIGNIEK